jgi:lysophospholipase L1-like esterase
MLYIFTMKHPLFTLLLAAAAASTLSANPIIKSGEKLAFLGDSITQYGASNPAGYVRLVVAGLEVNGITVDPLYAGISGNTSIDMLARVETDVLAKKPAFMTLSCGVNDVLKGADGVPLERYRENIASLVEKVQAAGVKPIILTATMISENPDEFTNRNLAPYNEFLRALAREKKLPLADINVQMHEAVKKAAASGAPRWNRDYYLTCDSIHMGPQGDQLMAESVLRVLGLNDTQIAKARAAWQEIPAAIAIDFKRQITLQEYTAIATRAAKENLSFVEFLDREFQKTIQALAVGP